MAVSAGYAYIEVRPDLKGFGPQLAHGIDGPVDRVGKGITSRLGGAFTSVAAIAGGAFAAVKVGQFFAGAGRDAEEARKVMAQTAAVIKSTGGEANVSAKGVGELADKLAGITGINDEAIAANQNFLLTFTNIRNGVGAGNDIFNQATATVLDMSVALGQDGKSSAMQLGKALNDPIKGITALSRVGVTFTDGQKDQIKAMVAAGDTMGAQKIILAELNKEFGGSAAAAASPMAKWSVAWGNLKEKVGGPVLKLAGVGATLLTKGLEHLMPWLDKVGGGVKGLFDLFTKGDFTGALANAFGWQEDAPIVATLFRIRDAVMGLFNLFVRGDFTGALARALHVEEDSPLVNTLFRIRDVLMTVGGFIRDHIKPIVIGLGIAFGLVVSPLLLLAGAVVYAYTKFEGFRSVVNTMVGFIVQTFGQLVGWVRENWGQISEAISHVLAVIQAYIAVWVTAISIAWRMWGDEILAVARVIWDQIRNTIETVIRIIQGVISFVLAVINGDWGKAWDALWGIVKTIWEYIRETVVNALRMVGQAVEAGMSAVRGLWDAAWGGVEAAVSGVWGSILGVVRGAIREIGNLISGFLRGVAAVADAVGADGIAGALRRAAGTAGAWGESSGPARNGRNAEGYRYAEGGEVYGPSGIDKVRAWLTRGEYVLPKWLVDKIGPGVLDAWIGAKRFAEGGIVDTVGGWVSAGVGAARGLAATGLGAIWPKLPVPGGLLGVPPSAANSARQAVIDAIAGKAEEASAAFGPGASVNGLTLAAQAMVNAVLTRFPGQRMTSGYRTPAQNAAVGGAPNSDHMYGRAADFAPGSDAVASYLRGYPGIKQVLWQVKGHYDHVHGATLMHNGGIVPGRPGQETLVRAQAGERVIANGDEVISQETIDRLAAALAKVIAGMTVVADVGQASRALEARRVSRS